MGVGGSAVVSDLVAAHHEIPVRAVVVRDRVGEGAVEVGAESVGVGTADAREPCDASAEASSAQEVGEVAGDFRLVGQPVASELGELVTGAACVPGILARPEPDPVRDDHDVHVSGVDEAHRGAEGRDVAGGAVDVASEEAEELGVGLEGEAKSPARSVADSSDAAHVWKIAGDHWCRVRTGSLGEEVRTAEVVQERGVDGRK